MLRFPDRKGSEMLYGPTNEEMITQIFLGSVKSYRDLPRTLYHIQWKFRDEVRPRFGIMRGREFLMKDAYSFDLDEAGMKASYEAMFVAYLRTFARLGLQAVPVRAPTGPIGGDLSHEFHILADTGESTLFYDAALEEVSREELLAADAATIAKLTGLYAMEEEAHAKVAECPVPADRLRSRRGIEVGHIFAFGTKYSEGMGFSVQAADGGRVHPFGGRETGRWPPPPWGDVAARSTTASGRRGARPILWAAPPARAPPACRVREETGATTRPGSSGPRRRRRSGSAS